MHVGMSNRQSGGVSYATLWRSRLGSRCANARQRPQATRLCRTNRQSRDATNPIAEAEPVDGVLQFFTAPNDSLMERLQQQFPSARFVKAFNSVGNAVMVNPTLRGGPPTMFYCGNDADAKRVVADLLVRFGWEPVDMGTATAARAIEPLCQLWCIPGFREQRWTHAFKLIDRT